ncbi:hypothetical protein PCI56_14350 [Plesiomonas shigelloides subsp. oncorhynchi]|nr:hypothetical protein [Plesiomonas shigelloides]
MLSLLSTLVLSPQASYALSEPEMAALMDVRAESDYQQLRSKWRSGFLGADSAQLDEELLARIATTNREANKQWANMLIAESRLSLWRDLPLDDVTEAGKRNWALIYVAHINACSVWPKPIKWRAVSCISNLNYCNPLLMV